MILKPSADHEQRDVTHRTEQERGGDYGGG